MLSKRKNLDLILLFKDDDFQDLGIHPRCQIEMTWKFVQFPLPNLSTMVSDKVDPSQKLEVLGKRFCQDDF